MPLLAHKPLATHVILGIKRYRKGSVSRFKAHIVASGNLQREGMNFEAVYAPVVDFTITLSTTLVCLSNNWKFQRVDVKATFSIGDIDRDVFVYHTYNLSLESGRDTV